MGLFAAAPATTAPPADVRPLLLLLLLYSHSSSLASLRYAGHAGELAKSVSLEGVDALCALGGDGTLCEVMSGMLSREDGRHVPLGFLPGGTGNSVMCDLGTWSAAEAAKRVAAGVCTPIDVNKVTDERGLELHSCNVIAFGVVGDAGSLAECARCVGESRYDLCGLWLVGKRLGTPVELEATTRAAGAAADDPEPFRFNDKCFTGFIMANQYFGKGLRAAPMARLDDGVADLILAPKLTRGEGLRVFLQLPSGSHAADPLMVHRTVTKLTAKFPGGRVALNVDGEVVDAVGTVSVQVLPGAVKVFAPADAVAGRDAPQ